MSNQYNWLGITAWVIPIHSCNICNTDVVSRYNNV